MAFDHEAKSKGSHSKWRTFKSLWVDSSRKFLREFRCLVVPSWKQSIRSESVTNGVDPYPVQSCLNNKRVFGQSDQLSKVRTSCYYTGLPINRLYFAANCSPAWVWKLNCHGVLYTVRSYFPDLELAEQRHIKQKEPPAYSINRKRLSVKSEKVSWFVDLNSVISLYTYGYKHVSIILIETARNGKRKNKPRIDSRNKNT